MKKERLFRLHFSLTNLLTGLGFCLTFGWLWFSGLRHVVLGGLFAMPDGQLDRQALCVFGIFLSVGFLFSGFVSSYLLRVASMVASALSEENSPSNKNTFQRWAVALFHGAPTALKYNAALIHGGSLLLAVVALLTRGYFVFFPALLGLAAALPCFYWAIRLLAVGKTGVINSLSTLAWASLINLILQALVVPLPRSPMVAFCAVSLGAIIAWGVSLLLARLSATVSEQTTVTFNAKGFVLSPQVQCTPQPFGIMAKSTVFWAICLLSAFFAMGAVNVLVPASSGVFASIAHVCGVFAVLCLLRTPDSFGRLNLVVAPLLVLFGVLLAVAVQLPTLARFSGVVFLATSALLESTGLAIAVLFWRHQQGIFAKKRFLVAAFCLVFLLLDVNSGYLVGGELEGIMGGFGPALPGIAPAFFLIILAWSAFLKWLRQSSYAEELPAEQTMRAPDQLLTHGEAITALSSGQSQLVAGGMPDALVQELVAQGVQEEESSSVAISLEFEPLLNMRERAVALMLIQGESNKSISEGLGLKEDTIRWYIKKLYKKTGSTGRSELIKVLTR